VRPPRPDSEDAVVDVGGRQVYMAVVVDCSI